jgi:penicillin-binding protein 1C
MPKPARYKRALPRVCIGALVILALTISWLALPKPPLLEGIDLSQRVRDRHGQVLRVTLTSDEKYRLWTPLSEIAPEFVEATLLFEDKHFWRHRGINPVSLLRSAWDLASAGHARAGASTITMQLARLRFQLHTRTLPGKLRQMLRALELERHYSKEQILEAYLNLAPYGRNLEGIGAASEIYFGKSPAHLTRSEAVALSVVPQSPSKRVLLPGRENSALTSGQARWYDRVEDGTTARFSGRMFRAQARERPQFVAPHFVRQVLENAQDKREILSTLDLSRQQLLERRVANYIRENRGRGIQNAAALLIEFSTMEVLAQIGSADFTSAEIAGQVDGTRSRRSPGSTLKPFVYALALDQGRLHPLTTLKDAPQSFGGYNPENFDGEFLGPIRAADALARSRNIPAVALAAELAQPTLYEFLKEAHVRLPHPSSHYGLSLPLGGAEATMEELVRLYAALANGGQFQSLRRNLSDPEDPKKRLLSPEAAFLTLDMLRQIPRPGMTSSAADQVAPVFWKTGTSHGFRDAWSIAVFDRYVLAVWIGNFDGRRNATFIGRTCAAPLLFQMIDALRAERSAVREPFLPPAGANLKREQFCSVSGKLPAAPCPHRTEGWFIPGVSPISQCDVHREILVDAATGLQVAHDDGSKSIRREVYEFWPSDFLALFELAGVPRRSPPPFLPGTANDLLARADGQLRITSPANHLFVSHGAKAAGIPLRAETESGVQRIYWFADQAFLGASEADEILVWKPTPGIYQLTALDDHGRATSETVTLR